MWCGMVRFSANCSGKVRDGAIGRLAMEIKMIMILKGRHGGEAAMGLGLSFGACIHIHLLSFGRRFASPRPEIIQAPIIYKAVTKGGLPSGAKILMKKDAHLHVIWHEIRC